jgi:hypothetical protein
MKSLQTLFLSTLLLGQIFYGGAAEGSAKATEMNVSLKDLPKEVKLICRGGSTTFLSLDNLIENFDYFKRILANPSVLEGIKGYQSIVMDCALQDINFLLCCLTDAAQTLHLEPTNFVEVLHLADFLCLKADKKEVVRRCCLRGKITLMCNDGIIENISVEKLIENFEYFRIFFNKPGKFEEADLQLRGISINGRFQDVSLLLSYVDDPAAVAQLNPRNFVGIMRLASSLQLNPEKKKELKAAIYRFKQVTLVCRDGRIEGVSLLELGESFACFLTSASKLEIINDFDKEFAIDGTVQDVTALLSCVKILNQPSQLKCTSFSELLRLAELLGMRPEKSKELKVFLPEVVKLVCEDGCIENVSCSFLKENFDYFSNFIKFPGALEDVKENGFLLKGKVQDINFLLTWLTSPAQASVMTPTTLSAVWYLADFLMLKYKMELKSFFTQEGKPVVERLLRQAFSRGEVYERELARELGFLKGDHSFTSLMHPRIISLQLYNAVSDNGCYALKALGDQGEVEEGKERYDIVDLTTNEVIFSISKRGNQLKAFFSADGCFLAQVTYDEAEEEKRGYEIHVKIWNVKEKEIIGETRISQSPSGVYECAFSPDGKWFAVQSTSAIFNTASRTWKSLGRTLTGMIFTSDSKRLATLTSEGIEVLDLANVEGAPLFVKKGRNCRQVVFSKNNLRIGFLREEACEVYDFSQAKLICFENVDHFLFLPNNTLFFVGEGNPLGTFYHFETGKMTAGKGVEVVRDGGRKGRDRVVPICVSPDENYSIYGTLLGNYQHKHEWGGEIYLVPSGPGDLCAPENCFCRSITPFSFSMDSTMIAHSKESGINLFTSSSCSETPSLQISYSLGSEARVGFNNDNGRIVPFTLQQNFLIVKFPASVNAPDLFVQLAHPLSYYLWLQEPSSL